MCVGEAGVDWQVMAPPTRAGAVFTTRQVQPGERHHWQSSQYQPWSGRSHWRRHQRRTCTQEGRRWLRYGTPQLTSTRTLPGSSISCSFLLLSLLRLLISFSLLRTHCSNATTFSFARFIVVQTVMLNTLLASGSLTLICTCRPIIS